MKVLPPGTLLQLMYLRERLEHIPVGKFIEIGPGSGEVTQLLLDLGWSGKAYDLGESTVHDLKERFATEIDTHRLAVLNEDFILSAQPESVDLVISCMVMEHFDDSTQSRYMQAAERALKPVGLMIGIVPSSPEHWGIEDDIAGHCRRYTRQDVKQLTVDNKWNLLHVAGLTYPISNLLLPVSNFLVRRNESQKLTLSALDRTKLSGRRRVRFKTHFPPLLGLFLNPITLYPLHLLQKMFAKSDRTLVLMFEARPENGAVNL